MLADILYSQTDGLAAMAGGWLARGADAVSLWSDGQLLATWPRGVGPGEASLVVPITAGGIILGELCVSGDAGPGAQAALQADARLIASLGGLLDELDGMAAEMVGLHDQLLALYDFGRSTRSRLSLDEALQSVAQAAARLVKTDGAFGVVAPENAAPTLVQFPPGLLPEPDMLNLFANVRASGRELLLNALQAPGALPGRIQNLFMVSIRVREAPIAALALYDKPGGTFASPDLKMARALAEQAGVQIENVLLYQESIEQARMQTEMELARQVQLRLLPAVPEAVPGVGLAAASRPALQVGGDFFDFVIRPGGPLVFAVGDVTGKGMSAAMLMAMARTVFHNTANYMEAPTPDAILQRLNEDLYDHFTEVGMFTTAFVGQYAPGAHELTYANAGHSPVVYCPAGDPARLLEADGTAVGVLPVSLSEMQTVPFGPGDLLIVATDGFSEAQTSSGEMFGYERLLRLTEAAAGQDAEGVMQTLFQTVETFGAGHAQDDDQTLIVIKGVEDGCQ
jgi:phosphoserine phosphatase RsbU/P